MAGGAHNAEWRSGARIIADEWCTLMHLKKTRPFIYGETIEFFDTTLCKAWLDPHHYQNISAEVAEWHSQHEVCPTSNTFHDEPTCPGWILCEEDYARFCKVCPTSNTFHDEPTCPGWILCEEDYARFCRWRKSCTTPRTIELGDGM
jgi:hypothetical protein